MTTPAWLTVVAAIGVASLAQATPTIVPQSGHAFSVQALAALPKEGLLLTSESASGLRYWDLRAGLEVRRVPMNGITTMVTSPRGDVLYALVAKSVRALDPMKPEVSKPLPLTGDVLGISPDGLRLAVGSKSVTIYDVAGARVLASLPEITTMKDDSSSGAQDRDCEKGLDCAWIVALAFSPNADRVAVATSGHVFIWDIAARRVVSTIKARSRRVLQFSPDGRRLACGSGSYGSAKGYGGVQGIWDAATGTIEARLEGGPDDYTEAMQFTPDGAQLVVGGASGVRVYEAKTLKRVRERTLGGPIGRLLAFDERTLVAAESGRDRAKVHVLDWPSLAPRAPLTAHVSPVSRVDFRPGGHQLWVTRPSLRAPPQSRTARWDLDLAGVLAIEGDHHAERIVRTRLDLELRDANAQKRAQLRLPEAPNTIALSPDGALLAVAYSGLGAKLELYDAATGTRKTRLDLTALATAFEPIVFESSGAFLLTKDPKAGVVLRAPPTLEVKGQYPVLDLTSAWLTPDGRHLASVSPSPPYTLEVLDAKTGAKVFETKLERPQTTPGRPRFVINAGLTRLALFDFVNPNRELTAWDAKSGRIVARLTDLDDTLVSASFSDDGKLLATGGHSGEVHVWHVDSGRGVLLLNDDDDWLMVDPRGYFDASQRGGALVAVAEAARGYHVDQLALTQNRPDLLLERLELGDAELRAHFRQRAEHRRARAGIDPIAKPRALAVPGAVIDAIEVDGDQAQLKLSLDGGGRALKSYQVYVNDVPLLGPQGAKVSGAQAKVSASVALTTGANEIEVSATNVDGAESLRVTTTAVGPASQPSRLYFIGFGVSRYTEPGLQLAYAAKDVSDLAKRLEAMKGGFEKVLTRVYTDEEVGPAALEEAAKLLANARPADVVVLAIAGHGMYGLDAAAPYYYLTHGSQPDALADTALPFEALEGLLHNIAPRRKLFLMDTCESGERPTDAEPIAAPRAEVRSRGARGLKRRSTAKPRPYLRQRGRFIYNDLLRRSGAIVFSSSRGGELSYESAAIENGFFTEHVIAALSDAAADTDGDKRLSIDELEAYVGARVARDTGGAQHPTIDRDNIQVRFELPMVR